jgi:hypothetical protein
MPGDQYDCSVSDVVNYGKANQTETVLPQCNNFMSPTNAPCWRIIPDMQKCSNAPHLILDVFRAGSTPPPETHVITYCVTEV